MVRLGAHFELACNSFEYPKPINDLNDSRKQCTSIHKHHHKCFNITTQYFVVVLL